MKVYLIYALPSVVRPGSVDTGSKELYGITNKKKYFKKFMSIRKPELFTVRKEEMEKEEYTAICNRNRECVLQEVIYNSVKENSYPENLTQRFSDILEDYPLVLTFLEVQSVEEARSQFLSRLDIKFIPPYILSKHLMKYLKKLYYHCLYRMNLGFYPDYYEVLSEEERREKDLDFMYYTALKSTQEYDDDYELPDIYVNELDVFLMIYGHLLK